VQSGDAAAGTRFLQISRDSGSPDYAGQYVVVDPTARPLFLRTFVKVDASRTETVTLFEVQDTVNNRGLFIDLTVAGALTAYNRAVGQGFDLGASLSLGRWHCLELKLQSGASATLDVWLDGQSVSSTNARGAYTFDRIFVGANYTVNGGGRLFLDEIASSTSRVGCD
jgi:hypothetical protein